MENDKYYPLPFNLTIRKSQIHGLGLFSTEIISIGTNLGMTHYKHDEFQHGLIRTPLGGFINHSDEPNCETIDIGPKVFIMTIKDIMPEEEITLKYKSYSVA